MRIGAVYPQTEYGNDPGAIREFAQTVEDLGYSHIVAYDHVLGANPNRPGGWQGPYTYESAFQEPFVLFAYMAAVTSKVEFATSIIILPQRQTALVAKQTATLDVLSGGRLRLGIGIGWNKVEYVSLNENFHDRGKRLEEQIQVLQRLWSEPLVDYEGVWHRIPDAGVKPLPVQRSIPIWFGGHSDIVLRRTAKIAAGWMPIFPTAADAERSWHAIIEYASAAGRNPDEIGLEPRISYGKGDPDQWRRLVDEWAGLGATHLNVNTMGSGFQGPNEHLTAIRRFAEFML